MNTFGRILRLTTFGESHGVALGGVLDGVPAGIKITVAEIQQELDLRRPGFSQVTSARRELDQVEILSGVFQKRTIGTPIAFLVRNKNAASQDYVKLKNLFRPGHADFVYEQKFGLRDYRGGGRSSGRETVARVAAAAIAAKIFAPQKIKVYAFAEEIAGIKAQRFQPKFIYQNPVRAADPSAVAAMTAKILAAKAQGDSVGGVIGIRVQNVPVGLGEPVFDKVEAILGQALLSIGAVKGVEFGAGFLSSQAIGQTFNDEFLSLKQKKTNFAGGILGGITDGSEIIIRLAIKPTASISKMQNMINHKGQPRKIKILGRHDPCLVPRIVPVAAAMVKLVLADFVLRQRLNKISQ